MELKLLVHFPKLLLSMLCHLEPPRMDIEHRIIELPENETATLTCPIDDDSSMEIQWTKNGIPVTTSNTLQVNFYMILNRC